MSDSRDRSRLGQVQKPLGQSPIGLFLCEALEVTGTRSSAHLFAKVVVSKQQKQPLGELLRNRILENEAALAVDDRLTDCASVRRDDWQPCGEAFEDHARMALRLDRRKEQDRSRCQKTVSLPLQYCGHEFDA